MLYVYVLCLAEGNWLWILTDDHSKPQVFQPSEGIEITNLLREESSSLKTTIIFGIFWRLSTLLDPWTLAIGVIVCVWAYPIKAKILVESWQVHDIVHSATMNHLTLQPVSPTHCKVSIDTIGVEEFDWLWIYLAVNHKCSKPGRTYNRWQPPSPDRPATCILCHQCRLIFGRLSPNAWPMHLICIYTFDMLRVSEQVLSDFSPSWHKPATLCCGAVQGG